MVLFLANEAAAHSSGVSGHDMVIMTSTSLVVLFILGTAMVARSQAGTVPKGMAAVYEIIFDWLDGIAQGFMGREGRNYVPLSMSFFLFILMSNWAGLIPLPALVEVAHGEHVAHIPPFEAPSSSYNTTLSLAFLAFLAFNLLGLRKRLFPPAAEHHHDHEHDHDHAHGEEHHHHHNPGGIVGLWQWISHFWAPTPALLKSAKSPFEYALVPFLFVLFLGLNFVEEFARILSLSLRLYGNIFGEHTAKEKIMETMYNFLVSPDVVNKFLSIIVWGASLVVTLLGGLAGFIQAMVFTMLLLSYIAHAVADEH